MVTTKIQIIGFDPKYLAAPGGKVQRYHMRQVILRAATWDKSRMTLVDADTEAPLARLLPQDKTKNASGMRKLIVSENPSAAALCATEPAMPALLRKWCADYAATGLPPAYLPMEENTDEQQ